MIAGAEVFSVTCCCTAGIMRGVAALVEADGGNGGNGLAVGVLFGFIGRGACRGGVGRGALGVGEPFWPGLRV